MMRPNSMEDLVDAARAARERAYAPYSSFTVGAALLARDGSIVTAGNVENASYGLAICAERSAVVRALAQGLREFVAIAVAGPESSAAAPCGACRQVLNEFNPRITVHFTTPSGVVTTTLDALLPHAFGPSNLDPR